MPLALSDTGAQPETVQGQLVSADFFDVLGVEQPVVHHLKRDARLNERLVDAQRRALDQVAGPVGDILRYDYFSRQIL